MIFIEFISTDDSFPRGGKHYFVGASLAEVLADTKGGTEFGFTKFTSRRVITEEEEARSINLGFLEEGIKAVSTKGCPSFKLATPRGPGA